MGGEVRWREGERDGGKEREEDGENARVANQVTGEEPVQVDDNSERLFSWIEDVLCQLCASYVLEQAEHSLV